MISKMKRASTATAVSLTLIVAATAFADGPALNLALTSGIVVGAMMDGCLLGAEIGRSVTDANFDGIASLSSYFSNPLF